MRAFVLLFVPFFTACTEEATNKDNTIPDAVITSHVDGDAVREGDSELLTGRVTDADNDSTQLNVTWTVAGSAVCADSTADSDGAVSCEAIFGAEDGTVVLSVSDPNGATASATVLLEVQATDAPVANLSEPTATGQYYADQNIAFRGTVTDTEDAPEDLLVTFETDELGELDLDIEVTSEGDVEAFGLLPEGAHVVRLRVVDTDGKEGFDSRVITVDSANSAPVCSITTPEDSAASAAGEEVRFEGTASDSDVAADTLLATWESDIDGVLREMTPDSDGTIAFATSELTTNTHRIKLTVSDALGATCTTSIYYTVGTPPTVNLTAPGDGDIVSASEALTFTAEVNDEEDAPTALRFEWSADGEVFSEVGAASDGTASFPWDVSTWETGDHTIDVTVTDTDGLYASDTVILTINAPPNAPTVTIRPDPAYTADNLFASATGSTDPDASGSVTYRYVWFVDGIEAPDVTGAEFPSEQTEKDHRYRVDVFAGDGLHESPAGTHEIMINNTAPDITEVRITPDAAPIGTELTCSAAFEDADGDTVNLTYVWSDGTAGDTATIAEDTSVGSALTCTVTADDGDDGTATAAATATVTNTPPVMAEVTVTPDSGKVGDALTCAATATDDDGDAIAYRYTWSTGAEGERYIITADEDPGDTLTCTATATDTTGSSIEGTADATVTNTVPVVAVSMTFDTAAVGDTLTCTATASDADGETPEVVITWPDGSIGATYVVTAANDPSSTITCTATASDADGGAGSDSASTTVTNTHPEILAVGVTPTSGKVGDSITCEATAIDVDGGEPVISYAWSSGTEGETYTITADDSPGSTLTCTATASDSDGGTDTGTASATVDNTLPVMDSVSIAPAAPTNDNTLTCTASATDADADSPTLTFAWSTGATGAMVALTSANQPGDEITCTATATDATGATATGTAAVTVTNRAPTAGTLTISPDTPSASDSVTCTATGAVDPDGEDVTVDFSWSINDVPAGGGPTLDSGYSKGDTLTCTVVATDASDSIDTGTASVTVGNTPPVIDVVVLTPSSVYTNDTVSAVATATDTDGDAVTLSYVFQVNGTVMAATGSSLSGVSHFDKGDSISVVVTADDGEATDTVSSSVITVQNTAPSAPVVSVIQRDDPDAGIAGLFCSIDTPSSDADGDSVAYTIAWSVNGSAYAETETSTITGDTVPFEALDSDQEWTCEAIPDDGEASGAPGTGSLYIDTMGLPTSEMSFDSLSYSGTLIDYDIMADGSARVLTNTGSEYYVQGYSPDGTLEATVFVGTGSGSGAGVFVSRVSGNTIVALTSGSAFRYTYLNGDYEVLSDQVTIWTDDYFEFFDVAIDDTGRAVVMYATGETRVAWIDDMGTLLGTEVAFDISASNGGHVAMNQSTGAGIIASQKHSGDGIYYQRFNADFEWIDPVPVQMSAGYHFWYDGYTVGMNDKGDYVFLWWKSETKMGMAFYDSAGSRVAEIERPSSSWGTYDVFRLRHQEIPLNGDNFILGETYRGGYLASGWVVDHFEYTPEGVFVSESSTDYSVAMGLTIRTDGQGNAVVRDRTNIVALYDYP